MKTILAIAILGLAAACGGTEPTAAPSRFAGTWTGQAEFNAAAPFTATGSTTMASAVALTDHDDGLVRFTGFCPDGTGAIDLEIKSVQAVAHDVALCGPVAVGNCESTQLIMSFVDAEVLPDGSLRGSVAGWAVGCGTFSAAGLTITAHRGN